ncbi:MgtC/SapB family protein [Enterovibrio sp. ZSDZ35]|uniref:Protein MgtC n=1 Tax=Enterovibrio qingdaonensis TaxID=2899818 RepID=A0ABT5QN77_9GAMM|nr:MgtC/SapB family protein [Enterovibrio sp. ZSDZ35]MDD1782432.1 MgtC/SapB family protein [Enterovibrio sp. ZSDZ35]
MAEFWDISPFSWEGVLTCAACGWILGLERQLRGKPVGIRTAILIVLGTYVFMRLATSLSENSLDHARVLGQIVTGVGFLGAGVMMSRDGQIQGVTSAAVVWLMAGLGMIIAFDYGRQALLLCGFVLFVLVGIDKVETTFSSLTKGVHKSWEKKRKKTDKSINCTD